jgi:hypothetical protein
MNLPMFFKAAPGHKDQVHAGKERSVLTSGFAGLVKRLLSSTFSEKSIYVFPQGQF